MKKYFSTLLVLVLIVFTFVFSSQAFAQNTNLIHGVTPTKITATLHDEYLDVAGKPVTTDDSWEFWNVGVIGGDQYAKATLTIATTTMTWDGGTGEIPTTHSSSWEGTFSGGPNGKLTVSSAGYSIEGQLVDGQNIVYKNGKSATVNNPDAFDKWTEKSDTDEITSDKTDLNQEDGDSIKLPTTENWDEQPAGGMLDTSFPKVNKVMGDVELSDPDNRPSIWQKTWRLITNTGDWRVWEPATSGQQIKPGSSLKTTAGRAIMEFADGTKFILDRESKITFNAAGGFTIETGTGYMEYRKYGKKIILETRRGKFAIIGTTVSWDVDGDHIQFQVIEGQVEADPDDGHDPIMLTAGQEVLSDEFGMTAPMNFEINSSQARWDKIEQEIINSSDTKKTAPVNYLLLAAIIIGVMVIFIGAIIPIILLLRRAKKK
ncbi:MAG: FecR domain-containing protein [Patescibacteria group bacterium]